MIEGIQEKRSIRPNGSHKNSRLNSSSQSPSARYSTNLLSATLRHDTILCIPLRLWPHHRLIPDLKNFLGRTEKNSVLPHIFEMIGDIAPLPRTDFPPWPIKNNNIFGRPPRPPGRDCLGYRVNNKNNAKN
ncbi:hypothetical protein ACFE04_021716 [Oxalis oulophora]